MTAAERAAASAWRQSWAALGVSVVSRAVLGVVALLVLTSVLPALVGWQSSVVMSGSMAPGLVPGDVAVVRPVSPEELRPGQVLLVDDPDLAGHLRLHRLVAVEDDGLRLRGDANPRADSTIVATAAVHGVGTLRLPMIGRPTLWVAQGRVWPLAGTAVALVALIALALLHRSVGDPSAGPPDRSSTPRTHAVRLLRARPRRGRKRGPRALAVRRSAAVALAVLAVVVLPGTGARFTATTSSPGVTIPMAVWWNCADVSGPTGANAARYYALQENGGRTATNTGTAASANGTFSSSGVTYQQPGPACGTGYDKAVTFNGTSGSMWTTRAVTNPQTFSLQAWFRTSTTIGGKLIGFGNGTNGAASTQYDRHVYMTNAGKLAFGIYDGSYVTVTTPISYNDARWHLVTATFSPTSGMQLYVDSALIGSATTAAAENYTGYWRIGYDVVHAAWPGAPQTGWFAGSMAHVGIFDTVLTPAQVTAQYNEGT